MELPRPKLFYKDFIYTPDLQSSFRRAAVKILA